MRFLNINGTFKWPYIKNEILLDPKFSPNPRRAARPYSLPLVRTCTPTDADGRSRGPRGPDLGPVALRRWRPSPDQGFSQPFSHWQTGPVIGDAAQCDGRSRPAASANVGDARHWPPRTRTVTSRPHARVVLHSPRPPPLTQQRG